MMFHNRARGRKHYVPERARPNTTPNAAGIYPDCQGRVSHIALVGRRGAP